MVQELVEALYAADTFIAQTKPEGHRRICDRISVALAANRIAKIGEKMMKPKSLPKTDLWKITDRLTEEMFGKLEDDGHYHVDAGNIQALVHRIVAEIKPPPIEGLREAVERYNSGELCNTGGIHSDKAWQAAKAYLELTEKDEKCSDF